MKTGQTYHEFDCSCDFCKAGDTKHPDHRIRNDDGELMYVKDRDQICQATFKEHCQYPKCDCDRPCKITKRYVPEGHTPVTAAMINSTEFPRLESLMKDPTFRDERLAEIEAKLAEGYVGGMTEFWNRQRDFLLTQKGQEIMDVLDGSDQEDCYNQYEHYYGLDKPID